MIGLRDTFGQTGDPEELLAHYGMDILAIVAAAKKLI
jgi:transketolase C-terminal domain/subunit